MNGNRKGQTAVILRIVAAAVVVIAEFTLIISMYLYLRYYAVVIYLVLQVILTASILFMVTDSKDESYTIAWLVVVAILPGLGFVLYALWGRPGTAGKGRKNRRLKKSMEYSQQFFESNDGINEELAREHGQIKTVSRYLDKKGFPIYKNTRCSYFPLGELQFDAMIEDFEQAERFIFIEYFILNAGRLWDRISEVLYRKAAEGVEIRIMFDDFGSLMNLPDRMIQELADRGIKALRYNPIHEATARLYVNYRNHQKIVVIDGKIAYTGGTNLSDEYANLYEKHGHWKDTAIRMVGDAVWSMTIIFLQMWDGETGKTSDYLSYKAERRELRASGFFQPFADGPNNNPDNPAETMYRTLIANARDYVYITTPYLIITKAMSETLCIAAESGVDVRIITPKIWDHWYVHAVTRSNYRSLLKSGVRIYEYTPGYIHAKMIVSDNNMITGSINMDYRSFYLHFENGVWIYDAPVLKEIKEDILRTMDVSEEITLEKYQKRPWYVHMVERTIRIFEVLL